MDPMQKVIHYMKEKEIRPSELFRSFDKEVSSHISYNDLIARLKVSIADVQPIHLGRWTSGYSPEMD